MTKKNTNWFRSSDNRHIKARNIEIILAYYFKKNIEGFYIVDYWCWAGVISKYFSSKNVTHAIDYNLDPSLSSGSSLFLHDVNPGAKVPIDSGIADIVISNHVIEHVTDKDFYIKECFRILKPGWIMYLATPNKWWPKEPHYWLFLLHFLPKKMYYYLLIFLGVFKEEIYLETPISVYSQFSKYFSILNFTWKMINIHIPFLKSFLSNKLAYLSPTLIYIMKK